MVQSENQSGHSLEKLAALLSGQVVNPKNEIRIQEVTLSSQSIPVKGGTLFVAIKGGTSDGHRYIADAERLGAVAALVSDRAALGTLTPGIVVPNTRVALSRLAAFLVGEPSQNLKVIGITGTNGKTTTNWVVQKVLNQLGFKCARLGTLGVQVGTQQIDTGMTTPDAYAVQRFLGDSVIGGCKAAVLEVSSHALDQSRADDVDFDLGVFTNLTRDHLDYHPTFEAYFQAKRRLFELMSASKKSTKAAIINIDDSYGAKLRSELKNWRLKDLSFGFSDKPAILIQDLNQDFKGSRFVLHYDKPYEIVSPYIGAHNAQNLAAAFAVCIALGFDGAVVAKAMRHIAQVPGRLQSVRVSETQPFGIYVDYAHSPDALVNVLKTLRGLTSQRLAVLFGCGGDRDRGKRPVMREVALQYADRVVVTSDNPRTEDPSAIIDEIMKGSSADDKKRIDIEIDRKKAIGLAIGQLKPGDILLIAGKGHEDYQIIGTEKHHFSDVEEAQRYL